MIDTLNMWIDTAAMASGNPFDITAYLSNIEEKQSERQGYRCSGTIGNYQATITSRGIFLYGSLSKYYLPSNVYTLTRRQIGEALQMMSDQLHIDVSAATVTRADISTVIPTKRPPADYYSELGSKERFTRLQTHPDTLEYLTKKRVLVFYDKRKEAAAKKAIEPPTLADCPHLLRYELRFMAQPHRQLKQADPIPAARLANQDFYCLLVQRWKQEFDTIKKLHRHTLTMENVKTPNDVNNAVLGYLMQQYGGQELIDTIIADLKARNQFADPKYYSRARSNLNKVLQAAGGQESDLMRELEKAIADIARYAR